MRTGSGRFAYIDRPTFDGRKIVKSLTHRDLPLPVVMRKPITQVWAEGGGRFEESHIVGKVTAVSEAIAYEMFAALEIHEDWAIELLESEQHYLEMDIDSAEVISSSNGFDPDAVHTMEGGRLCTIHLGKSPCWPGLEFRLNPA